MTRQEKTDAEQLFIANLEQNKERVAKVAARMGERNLIEIAAHSFRLFDVILDSLPKERRELIQRRIDELREGA